MKKALTLLSLCLVLLTQRSQAVALDSDVIREQLKKDQTLFIQDEDWSNAYFDYLLKGKDFKDLKEDLVFQSSLQSASEDFRARYYERFSNALIKDLTQDTAHHKTFSRSVVKLNDYLDEDPNPTLAIQTLFIPGLQNQDLKTTHLFITATQCALLNHSSKSDSDKAGRALQDHVMDAYLRAVERIRAQEKNGVFEENPYDYRNQDSYPLFLKIFSSPSPDKTNFSENTKNDPSANCSDPTAGNESHSSFSKIYKLATNTHQLISNTLWGSPSYQEERKAIAAAKQAAYPHLPNRLVTQARLLKLSFEIVPELLKLQEQLETSDTQELETIIDRLEPIIQRNDRFLHSLERGLQLAEQSARAAVKDIYLAAIEEKALEAIRNDLAPLKRTVENALEFGGKVRLIKLGVQLSRIDQAKSTGSETEDQFEEALDKLNNQYDLQLEQLGGFPRLSPKHYRPAGFIRTQILRLLNLTEDPIHPLTPAQINRSYRMRLLQVHPDKGGNSKDYAELVNAMNDYRDLYSDSI